MFLHVGGISRLWLAVTQCLLHIVHTCKVTSVLSSSLWPYGLLLLCPWDYPRQEYWSGLTSTSRGSFWPRDWTLVFCVSCTGRRVLEHLCHLGSPLPRIMHPINVWWIATEWMGEEWERAKVEQHAQSHTPSKSLKVEVLLSCLTLCDPMDYSLSGSSVHGIFQARALEWVAISFSRESSLPRDQTKVSRIVGRRFLSDFKPYTSLKILHSFAYIITYLSPPTLISLLHWICPCKGHQLFKTA